MISTLRNAWKIPDLRSKIVYTFMMLVIFRLGSVIPVPGINIDYVRAIVSQAGLLGFFDLFSGGAFGNMTIFALSITPYITASIIMQLLTIAIPSLEEMAKEGEEGRKKIAQYTRYATVVLALIQAAGISIGLFGSALISRDPFSVTVVVLTLTAGTAFLMWLGEQITEKGIGNGISLLIFAGIVSRVPFSIKEIWFQLQQGTLSPISLIVFLALSVVIIAAVVAIQEGTRKIPVQYAKRVVGRKMYGGQSSHIPLKVNQSGVIPVIFAMSLLSFPQTISLFFGQDSGFANWVATWLNPNSINIWGVVIYSLLSAVLIIFFTYFYTAITFNPVEISTNMKKHGGFIPGIRPGKPTTDYLNKVLNRITLAGAVFLATIALLPTILMRITGMQIAFGGTALLIVVGVALETMKQVEAQMLMRHYQGFLK
ncbi:preprotein translocase subunit SecY [Alkaliphilus transvaalensis]|uniref:preprotein translocase subunit SecY n=1 Tax=Alkaliphilus transvaalensis TaxID=114628 RepID=UPI00047B4F6F|nr:preprotein translocase subunit SecY [Alkaliphilus transvaalensis]